MSTAPSVVLAGAHTHYESNVVPFIGDAHGDVHWKGSRGELRLRKQAQRLKGENLCGQSGSARHVHTM